MRRGFTLTEMLVVVGIVAVLAAIIFPIYARARESANRAACLTQVKGLGTAIGLYVADADDHAPMMRLGFFGGRVAMGLGWAGRVVPYARGTGGFACRSDKRGVRSGTALPGAQTVSYGINSNLARETGISSSVAASRTVLLFEVSGGRALLSATDEGDSIRPGTYRLVSPTGDGTDGGLLAETSVWPGPGKDRFTLYATGEMDNAASRFDVDDTDDPRHGEGANFLALDGHAAWSKPEAVSAGHSAASAGDVQSPTGCPGFTDRGRLSPCAEGTAVGRHRFTFSAE